jgi:hypothetical protein
MQMTTTRSGSLLNLISGLREESKTFLRQEVQLAKTELAEKASAMGRNAVFVAAGGAVAYCAAILLFVALSFLLVFAFEKMGLSHEIALFSGPLVLAVLLGLAGFIVIRNGLSGISETKLAPEKAIETFTHEPVQTKAEKKKEEDKPKPDSTAIKSKAEKTRDHLESTMTEIKHRVSPAHIRDTIVLKVKGNPVAAASIAVGSIGGLWALRRHKKARRLACKAC